MWNCFCFQFVIQNGRNNQRYSGDENNSTVYRTSSWCDDLTQKKRNKRFTVQNAVLSFARYYGDTNVVVYFLCNRLGCNYHVFGCSGKWGGGVFPSEGYKSSKGSIILKCFPEWNKLIEPFKPLEPLEQFYIASAMFGMSAALYNPASSFFFVSSNAFKVASISSKL